MPYVPSVDVDVFVSYAHTDNDAVEGELGWVTDFTRRFGVELHKRLGGSDATIWWDARLGPSSVLDESLERRLHRTAVLLAIVSPSYAGSGWCSRELHTFLNRASQTAVTVGDKLRIIKVLKQPHDDVVYPHPLLQKAIGVDFYRTDPDSGVTYELQSSEAPYGVALGRLASDVADVLSTMRRSRTVFVTGAPNSLVGQRTKLCAELEAREYRVLYAPDSRTDESVRDIEGALRDAGVSVLFRDAEDPTNTWVEPLLQEAATRNDSNQVTVLNANPGHVDRAWHDLPSASPLTSSGSAPAQGSSGSTGASNVQVLVNRNPEEVKDAVIESMHRVPEQLVLPPSGRVVYLVCDHDDNPLVNTTRADELREYLLRRGHEVKLPVADKRDPDYSRDNRRKLRNCNGVLLFWGNCRQSWFDERLDEINQAHGWRKKAFDASAGYLSGPRLNEKAAYRTRQVKVLVKQFSTFDPDDAEFKTFIDALEQP
jgi:hypothetical protein